MFERRYLAGLATVALLAAACGMASPSPMPGEGAPTNGPTQPTPAGAPGPDTPAPDATDRDAALSQLCDPQQEASLANLAAQLEQLNEAGDPAALTAAIERLKANLELAPLGPDAMSIRDAAVGQMNELTSGIEDPAARQLAASSAANMLRELEAQLCPPPEL